MAEISSHSCVFFDDDGWSEPVCACGQRAVYLVDEQGAAGAGAEPVLVLLDDRDSLADALTGRTTRVRQDLAISA